VLEGIGESRELARGVGVGLEERSPVQRAEAHRGILQPARRPAERRQALRDAALLLARLLEVLAVEPLELRVARHRRRLP
jgi:hypothetical protein